MTIDRRTQTSYHEAGHSCVAAALGVRVHSVTIIPNGSTNGLTVHSNSKGHVLTHCSILLAGGLAVNELHWRRGDSLPPGCWHDLERFDEYLRELGAKNYDSDRREEWDEWRDGEALALQTLSDHWGAVEALAAALLKHGTIRGELVHGLVAAHKQKAKNIEALK